VAGASPCLFTIPRSDRIPAPVSLAAARALQPPEGSRAADEDICVFGLLARFGDQTRPLSSAAE
jgi:hypothetical protein